MGNRSGATWGVIVAGGALVVAVAALGEGVIDPLLAGGTTGCAAIAAIAFSARRHDRLAGPSAGAVCGVAGLGLAVCGTLVFAIHGVWMGPVLGILGLIVLSLAANELVDEGIHHYSGGSRVLLVGTAIGFGGLAVAGIVASVPTVIAALLAIELPTLAGFALQQLGIAVGLVGATLAFVVLSGRGIEYVDVHKPSQSDARWTVVGIVVVLLIAFLISTIYAMLNIETATHVLERRGRQEGAEILLVAMVFAFLAHGLGEELLFRNGVQKYFTEHFSAGVAILASSAVFAAGHIPAYAALDPIHTIGSLVIVFSLSLVLAVVYERTGNVLVPIIIHGVYNAIIYFIIYLTIVG